MSEERNIEWDIDRNLPVYTRDLVDIGRKWLVAPLEGRSLAEVIENFAARDGRPDALECEYCKTTNSGDRHKCFYCRAARGNGNGIPYSQELYDERAELRNRGTFLTFGQWQRRAYLEFILEEGD